MYIPKTIVLGTALIFAVCLYGKNSSEKSKLFRTQENSSQMDLSQIDTSNCSSIKCSFKVWHETNFYEDKYAKITKQFIDLRNICQQSDWDQTGFDSIVKIIGNPFKDIVNKIAKKDSIHGGLILNIKNDFILLELVISHEDTYDEEAWQVATSVGFKFFENEQWIKELSPIFTDVINAGDESGIHGSLNISTE